MIYNRIITLFNSIFNSNVRLWGFFFSIFEVIFFFSADVCPCTVIRTCVADIII